MKVKIVGKDIEHRSRGAQSRTASKRLTIVALLILVLGFGGVVNAVPRQAGDTRESAVQASRSDENPGDGSWQWASAAPDEVGFNSGTLEAAVDKIGRMDGIYSLLIIRNGYLVLERYYREGYRDKPHNLKSASKSVLSALVGIAIDEGKLRLDQPISEILPQARNLKDPRKSDITIRHLLSMTSGLTPTSYESYSEWVLKEDWVKAALEQPLVADPGARFQYSTADTHILSAALTAATGMSTRKFAVSKFFEPMEITVQGWAADPIGIYQGGNNLALIPRDMAKIGQLYLEGGKFEGHQILPAWWVDVSTRPGRLSTHQIYGAYGYLWYSRPGGTDSFVAVGYGGQYIYVSPSYNTVIVITSTLDSKGQNWETQLFRLVHQGLLASIEMGPRPIRREGLQIATSMNPAGQSNPSHIRLGRTKTRLNLRKGPSQNDGILKILASGTDLEIREQSGPWFRVSSGELKGWVFARYVEILPSGTATALSGGAAGVKLSFAVPGQGSQPGTPPVSAAQTEEAAVQTSREVLARRLRASQKTETQLVDELGTLLDQVEEQRKAAAVSEAARRNLAAELAAARKEIKSPKGFLKEVEPRKKGGAVEAAPEALKRQLASTQSRLEAVEKTLTDSQNDRAWLTAELERVGSELQSERAAAGRTEAEKNRAAAELKSLRDDYSHLSERLEKAEIEKKAFQISNTALTTDLAERNNLLALSQESKAHLEEKLVDAGQQIETLGDSARAAAAERAEIQDRFDRETTAFKAQLGVLEKALKEQRERGAGLTNELAGTKEQLEKEREMARQSETDREALSSRLAALLSENDRLAETLKAAQTAREDLSVKTVSLSKELAAQQETAAQWQSSQAVVEKDLAAAREQIMALQSAAAEEAEVRDAINQETATLKAELAAVQTNLDKEKTEAERLTTELARVGEALERQREMTSRSDRARESLKLEMADLRSRNTELSQSLNEAEAAGSDLEVKVASLTEALTEQREMADRSSKAESAATEELASAREEIQRLNLAVLVNSTEVAELEEKSRLASTALKAEMAKLEKSFYDEQDTKVRLTAQVAQLRQELEEQQEMTAKAETRREAVVLALADLREQLEGTDGEREQAQVRQESLNTELAAVRRELSSLKMVLDDSQRIEKAELTASIERAGKQYSMADGAPERDAAPAGMPGEGEPVRADVQVAATVGASLAPGPDGKEIESFVRAWAISWERQDVQGYLAHYSKDFRPARGLSLSAWRKGRERRIAKPVFIKIGIDRVEAQLTGPSQARVTFEQDYRSNSYGDRVMKTLELQWEKGTWAIVRESSRAI